MRQLLTHRETMKNWPILLTGTIVQNRNALAIRLEPQERERQYLEVLRRLGTANTGITHVIFCENSCAPLDVFFSLCDLYAKYGRTLEIYKVPMPTENRFLGKGWGEGIIVRWALENIQSLNQADGFIKLTGRFHILNIDTIVSIVRQGQVICPDRKFICQSLRLSYKPLVTTQLWWSNTEFYKKHMVDVYEGVDDQNGIFLEHVVADRLIALRHDFTFAILPISLILHGVDGSTGKLTMSRFAIYKQKLIQRLLPLPELIPFNYAYSAYMNRAKVQR